MGPRPRSSLSGPARGRAAHHGDRAARRLDAPGRSLSIGCDGPRTRPRARPRTVRAAATLGVARHHRGRDAGADPAVATAWAPTERRCSDARDDRHHAAPTGSRPGRLARRTGAPRRAACGRSSALRAGRARSLTRRGRRGRAASRDRRATGPTRARRSPAPVPGSCTASGASRPHPSS